ncbi:MAG TPA: OmpA family protein [Flavobacteriales bacterium]|nr:OmpA family protein [Flavobacteriales bacterium]HRP80891.1 OmpA family protein [Flavobacteriales bacterium]
MYHRTILLSILLLTAVAVGAQTPVNVPFDKVHITDGQRLKTALAAMKKGDDLAAKGGVDNPAAMTAYEVAFAINPDNAELNFRMGVCLLNGPHPAGAVARLQRAAELDPYLPRVHFLLGHALQLNARWEEAIASFERHAEVIRRTPDPDRTYNMVGKRITECRNGRTLQAAPTRAVVAGLGPAINTPGSEYGALLGAMDDLYFTARRPETTGGRVNKVNNTWFEDIYVSNMGATGWTGPRPAPGQLNSNSNDATVSMDKDGGRMIIYRDEKNGGDLYESTVVGGKWSAPVPLPATVNSPAQESSAWRTDDGQWLYFVSSREGGLGGSDIYRSPWDGGQGTWGAAENLGPDINTIYDEEGVFAPGDGSTIYFASQGHSSMGGYDLFKSSQRDGRWTKPENLGWPINSPGDDQFLVLAADGRSGFFSSMRPGGQGEDDIYRVDFPAEASVAEPALLASAGMAVPIVEDEKRMRLVAFVKGLKLMDHTEAIVQLKSLDEPLLNITIQPDPASGSYIAEVPVGRPFAIHVQADGFLLHSEHVDEHVGENQLEMSLTPSTKGNSEVMRNIFFKHDNHALDEASTVELQTLADYLKANPGLRLEVGGHTDSDVGPIPNQKLSEARAQVVVNWLVEHGISPDRLEAKGYGDSQPVVPNDSPEHKALNRRTEIRVL